MKATVVKTDTYFGAAEAAARMLEKARFDLDGRYVVFCEDKLTVTLESEILAKQEGGCSFNVEVSTFSRFLTRCFAVRSTLSKEGAAMAVSRIIGENSRELAVLGALKGRKNTASAVYEQIMQLRSAEVTADELMNFKEDSFLGRKIADVGLVYREYLKFLSGGYFDESEALSLLPQKIRESGELAGANVFLVGYSSFTRQMAEVIRSILECAGSVTAVFADNRGEAGVHTGEAAAFFKDIAAKARHAVEEERVCEPLCAEAEAVSSNLFTHRCFALKEKTDTERVFCYYAENIADELNFIAENIAYGVRNGMRYRDFALLLPEPDSYAGKLEEVFSDCGIPYFLDTQESLSESVLYSLLSAQIEISRKNYAAEDVVAFIKNVLFEQNRESSDAFENYVISRGISRKGFFREFTGEAEAVRKKFTQIYVALPPRAAAGSYAALLKEQAELLRAEEGMKELKSVLEESGEGAAAKYAEQAYDKTVSLLTQIEEIMGGAQMSLEEFANVFASGAESLKIRLIPVYFDAVYVGKTDESKGIKPKYLFAAGLNSDVPGGMADTAFFTDRDILRLRESGIGLEPDIRVVNERKRSAVGAALASFSERLFLSYPALSPKGKAQKGSEIFEYVDRIFCRKGKPLTKWSAARLQAAYSVASEERRTGYDSLEYLNFRSGIKNFAANAGAYADGAAYDVRKLSCFYAALKKKGLQESADKILVGLGEENRSNLPAGRILESGFVSASALEDYFGCPYRYFLSRVLKLKKREEFAMKSADTGNFLHKTVEVFVNRLKDGDNRRADDIIADSVKQVLETEEYAARRESPAQKALLERLEREAYKNCRIIYAQIKDSGFEILGTEINFGADDGDFPPLKLSAGGGEYRLIGKVDRADCTDTHIRIVDYKSGKVDAADSALFTGRKLQLYLYMAALKEGTGKKAAGVYYYPISDDFSEENLNLLKGNSLADEKVLLAQDKNISAENPVSVHLAVKFKAENGELKAAGNSLLSEEEFDAYVDYAKKVSEKALSEISEGKIELSPYREVCGYCEMSGICGYEEELCGKTRKVAAVGKDTICGAVKARGGEEEI